MICSQCLCSLEAPAGCQWVCVLALGEGPKAGHSRTQGRGRGWSRRSKVTPTAYNHPHRAGLLPGPLSLSLFYFSLSSLSLSSLQSNCPPFLSSFKISTILFPPPSLFFSCERIYPFNLFHLYNSVPLYPLLHFIFLSLCLPLSLEVQMDTFAG